MLKWNETINIAGLHRLYSTGGIGIQQVAKGVIRKLQNTEAFAISDPELMDVMFALNAVDEVAMVKDYNCAVEMLYEFGDKENRLLVVADEVSPQEYDEIPSKQKHVFDDDTKPQKFTPHRPIGPAFKGPYAAQAGGEWVKYPAPEIKKPDDDDTFIMWESTKAYKIGDLIRWKNVKYECTISCTNVDPEKNSFGKPGDAWKWRGAITHKPFDPALAFSDRITCVIKGKPYTTGRKYRYMSEDEFNKKLAESHIDPPTVPRDLYVYWKDCESPYQEWLIDRWHKQNLTFREPVTLH